MSANEMQVGGTHYKEGTIQHWDMVHRVGFGWEYYLGNATKYLTRFPKKNGLADLLKAEHYVVKLHELIRRGDLPAKFWPAHQLNRHSGVKEYVEGNGITNPLTMTALSALFYAQDVTDVVFALECTRKLIAQTKTSEDTIAEMRGFGTGPGPGYVNQD